MRVCVCACGQAGPGLTQIPTRMPLSSPRSHPRSSDAHRTRHHGHCRRYWNRHRRPRPAQRINRWPGHGSISTLARRGVRGHDGGCRRGHGGVRCVDGEDGHGDTGASEAGTAWVRGSIAGRRRGGGGGGGSGGASSCSWRAETPTARRRAGCVGSRSRPLEITAATREAASGGGGWGRSRRDNGDSGWVGDPVALVFASPSPASRAAGAFHHARTPHRCSSAQHGAAFLVLFYGRVVARHENVFANRDRACTGGLGGAARI